MAMSMGSEPLGNEHSANQSALPRIGGTHGPVILVVGGGYVGLYTVLRLQKKLSRGRAEIMVVDHQPHMTYQPFLPEAAAGSVEPCTWSSRCAARSTAAGSSPARSPG